MLPLHLLNLLQKPRSLISKNAFSERVVDLRAKLHIAYLTEALCFAQTFYIPLLYLYGTELYYKYLANLINIQNTSKHTEYEHRVCIPPALRSLPLTASVHFLHPCNFAHRNRAAKRRGAACLFLIFLVQFVFLLYFFL